MARITQEFARCPHVNRIVEYVRTDVFENGFIPFPKNPYFDRHLVSLSG